MFHPRVVLCGTANDVEVSIGANEAAVEIEVIDTTAKITTEVTFTNTLALAAQALYITSHLKDKLKSPR